MAVRYIRSTNIRNQTSGQILGELALHGVTIPAPVSAAKATLDRLEERGRTTLKDEAHRADAVAALLDDPEADIAQYAAAELMADVLRNTLVQATDQARRRLKGVMAQHADELCEGVREVVFEPARETLVSVAERTSPSDTASALLLAGKAEEAKLLAEAPIAAAALSTAFSLRNQLYPRSEIADMICRTWENPPSVDGITGDSPEGYFVAGLRAGGRLWFGTYPEVDAASRRLKKDEEEAQKKAIGSYVNTRRSKKSERREIANERVSEVGFDVQQDQVPAGVQGPDAA